MAHPNSPDDERTPNPASVTAGPQSGPGGAGGEPKGARLQAQEHPAPRAAEAARQPRADHSSDKSQPEYRTRPAGQSGLGPQDDRTSTIREPHGDGSYVATDHGDKPLRSG